MQFTSHWVELILEVTDENVDIAVSMLITDSITESLAIVDVTTSYTVSSTIPFVNMHFPFNFCNADSDGSCMLLAVHLVKSSNASTTRYRLRIVARTS